MQWLDPEIVATAIVQAVEYVLVAKSQESALTKSRAGHRLPKERQGVTGHGEYKSPEV